MEQASMATATTTTVPNQAYRNPCRKCLARPGARCLEGSAYPADGIHQVRLQAPRENDPKTWVRIPHSRNEKCVGCDRWVVGGYEVYMDAGMPFTACRNCAAFTEA